MPELISSHSNPLVKLARSVRQPKGRRETGLFLVEGIHHVGEAAVAGWDLETILYAPDLLTSDFGLRLVDEQSRRGVRVVALTRDLFADLTDKDNPQGLLALIHQRTCQLENLQLANLKLAAAVVSPQDPGNVGTILRTIDAVGADALFQLDGGVDPFHPSSVRASMGTIFSKPLIESSFDEFTRWAKKNNICVIGSSAHAETNYRNVQLANVPTVLLLGSEQKGLLPEQMAACDLVVSLPMRGRASSLNLAVAAGILLYAFSENV
jgi:RNA methyltransferase, TrmH family